MKFKIFLFQLMGICFAGLTSVVGASPLDTIPPPITDFFIPVNQRSVEPVRNPGDFIGRVFAPKPEDWQTRPEAQPITGVTVMIASGPRAGESVATNPSGYYRFPNVKGDELHLRVEKEHFEPKEVRVHRSRPTILANGDVLNYKGDPQQHPGNILMGHRWPDEVRFILEEILVVHDLLYVEGRRLPKGTDLGGFYSLGVVVGYSYQYADWGDAVGLLGTFAHEIAHAHQHATVSVDGSAWEIHGWQNTPEGRAYEEARRKDWEQVGKSRLDNIYGSGGGGGVALTETAAETCAHYWSVDRWGGRTAYGLLEVEAPNRYKWAEKWVPVSIPVRPPPKVVSIPDRNLAAAVRKALDLSANARITDQAMQRLTRLDARKNQIKDLTGLEHATRLRRLILDDNQVRDITPLENLTQLTWLHMSGNPISDFTPLVNLNQLERLALWGDNIDDVALLANKTKLTHLWLGENNVSDITPLENLTQLKLLYLPHNQIRDVTPLAGLTNLETLHLQDNSIRDISPLAGLTKLTDLRLGDNPITDKSPLRSLKDRNPELKLDIEIPPPAPVVSEDVNSDGIINILDLVMIAINFGKTGQNPADVNADGIVNIIDLVKVAGEMGAGAAAPSAHPQTLEILTATDVRHWLTQAQQVNLTDATSQRGILILEQLLAALIPKETSLLPNYPNPFNPETWIPYQLAEPTDVTLTIYAVDGEVVRQLALGYQAPGMYHSKNRAVYWDGKNEVGEQVASGIYFYTLTADDFITTRKMLILK